MKLFSPIDLHELCFAIVQLERLGFKYCSDYGYDNAIDKYKQVKSKKWICPVCHKTYGEEIQSCFSDFQSCCGRGLDLIK